jgi:hypothetical protein
LHEAQPVAAREQAHGFGVDGNRPIRELYVCGQVFLVKVDSHSCSLKQA